MRTEDVQSYGILDFKHTVGYFQDQFVEDWDPTIEDLYVKKDQINGTFFQLEVQDTAGQEQFALLRDDYSALEKSAWYGVSVEFEKMCQKFEVQVEQSSCFSTTKTTNKYLSSHVTGSY